ncbi:TniB family NTP-binding protein [Neisseria sp. Dent CA1/247]|uniref:TniB family NTP-binding protein n=1 Tax=Neisseria sp. Dent CA1/247 TaxID=2912675 RepID=UPI001FD04AEF|nr:TniB family NTP-binding protein [Neisseria sp. Dent CA1/247]UOO77377.1 TniB family NTP-binding protein [Neisseria sp. Dent CA1/247]
MEKYEHINPKFRHIVAASSDSERINFARTPRWIAHAQAKAILQQLEDLLTFPKRPRMPNLLLVGEPNNGKTTLINKFCSIHGEPYETEDMDLVIPIVKIEAPSTASEKALYIAILEKMVAPYRDSATAEVLYTQCLHLMRTYAVKMLVIDEFHSMFSGSARKQREMMNALKRLCNELQIPIVGVGTPSASDILYTDSQFRSRFDIIHLELWENNDEFREIVATFESCLPLKKPSKLSQKALSSQIHRMTKGNLGNLSNLLSACAVEAIRNHQETITAEMLANQERYISTERRIR